MRTLLLLVLLFAAVAVVDARQQSASITTIAPTFGAPGTIVSIRGSGFTGFETGTRWVRDLANEPPPGAVDFNGVPGEILFWEDDLITVKVPKGASSGPVRLILPNARVAITAAEFDVYYSTPGQKPAEPIEFLHERSRSNDDLSRDETHEWRPIVQDRVTDWPLYYNPWFSSLTPGERTFLADQGFANPFAFGSPFSLGRRNSFLFGNRFGSGRFGFGEDVFVRNFFFHGSRNIIRPFPFFFNNPFRHSGFTFRR